MKKIILVLGLLLSCSVLADAKDVIRQRLDKINGFYAQFSQQVKTADNQLIQEGKGEFWLDRPNYFNWQIDEPDKTTIISDGKNMWLYVPAVEQVTVMPFDKAIDNQLLLLITDSQSQVWQDYNVTRKRNYFTLKPIENTQKSYTITVLPTGMVADFTIIEEDGQQSLYQLSHQHLGKVDHKRFVFTVPDGVIIDDQR